MKKNTIRKFKELLKGCNTIEDDDATEAIAEALRYIDFSAAEINVETLRDESNEWSIDKLVRVTVKLEGNTLVFDGRDNKIANLVSLNGFGVNVCIEWWEFQELLRIKENQDLYRIQAEPAYAVETLLSIADKHPSDYAEAMEEKVEDDPELSIDGKCLEKLYATPKRCEEENLYSWKKHLSRLNGVLEDDADIDIVVASRKGIEGSLILLFCCCNGDWDTIDEVEIMYYGEKVKIGMSRSFQFYDGKLEKVTQYNGGYLKTSCTSIAKDFIERALTNGVPFTIANQPLVNGMDNLKSHAKVLGITPVESKS